MEKTQIKVSILVSTYNWKEALALCLRSIFVQTVLPYEIAIADDGSKNDTRELIEKLKKESTVPIKHVWHEDKGFRKTIILNKAITEMEGDYIIEIDGDVVLSPYFISDHLDICQPNCFVCGSRVLLSKKTTEKILKTQKFKIFLWDLSLGHIFNKYRCHYLRQFLADRYDRDIAHARGCNMAYWRKDLIKVNGFNEDFIEWGYEDSELAYRLHFAGVHKRSLKFGGVEYHLLHSVASRENAKSNYKELERTQREKKSWCTNGLDKYQYE